MTVATSPSQPSLRSKPLESSLAVAAARQVLTFSGVLLSDGAATFGSVGIADGSTVYMTLPLAASLSTVIVALPSELHAIFGQTVTLSVGAADNADDIKAQLQMMLDIPAADQSLAFGSTTLDCSSPCPSLGSQGIVSGSVLTLSLASPAPTVPYAVRISLPLTLHPAHGPLLTLVAAPTVGTLKGSIRAMLGSSATADLNLTHNGTQLSDDSSALPSQSGAPIELHLPSEASTLNAVSVTLPAALQGIFGQPAVTLLRVAAALSDTLETIRGPISAQLGVPLAQLDLTCGVCGVAGATVQSNGGFSGLLELNINGSFQQPPHPVRLSLPSTLVPAFGNTLVVSAYTTIQTIKTVLRRR